MSDAPWGGRRLHFIGIGGAGMSGLAIVAAGLGAGVSGSDRAESAYFARLREIGIEPVVGHDAANVPEGAEVVVSTAIADDNAELAAARAAGLRVLHRGELLGEVSRLKRCLAVAGTHGKTTTASMTAHAMVECGHRPAYLVGGEVRTTGTNASWGQGDWVVVEADESDRSFLRLQPDVAVVTNVELDHHTTYRTLPEVEQAFAEFAGPAPTVIAPAGLTLHDVPPAVTFGIENGTFSARKLELLPGGSRFEVDGVEVNLRVPGRHNVLNALAALAACREAGVGVDLAAPTLAGFAGAGRRFEPHGQTSAGALVYDDYAHHPTEVRATLEAARSLEPRRLVAVFQPHLYSRTERMAREFGRALALADLVVVLEIYPARERAEDFPGVSGWAVAAATASAAAGRRVYWLPKIEDAEAFLQGELREGDLLLTLGAGDVDQLARRLGSGT
ncbi:MAG TPA: UDP-N-acetylmuramate--L-alanine ligase [Thermoleophilaceae bacterium]